MQKCWVTAVVGGALAMALLPSPGSAQIENQDPCWMYDPIGYDCVFRGGGGGGGGTYFPCQICIQTTTVTPDNVPHPVTWTCFSFGAAGLTGMGNEQCEPAPDGNGCIYSGSYCWVLSA